MNCIYCFSNNIIKNGHRGETQLFRCKDCKRAFCDKGLYAKMSYKPFIISSAIMLRMYRLSLGEVADVLKKLTGKKPNRSTIYRWIVKFYPTLHRIAKILPFNYTNVWHVDEKFIKVNGSKDDFAYLFVVADSKNHILATHVANARTTENAKIVLQKAYEMMKKNPRVIVTDKCQIYKKACKIFGRKTKHIQAHFKRKFIFIDGKVKGFSNNRIERINSDIDLFLHVFRGLKGFMSAQMWADLFMIWFNYCKKRNEKAIIEIEKIPEVVVYTN